MDFEPASWRKNSSSCRRRESEFVWKNGGKSVGRTSRVPPCGFFKTEISNSGVFIRYCSNLLYQKFLKNESLATRRVRRTPKKKCSLLFRFARDQFFLKKERTFFLWCSALQVFGQVAGLQFGLGFAKTIFWGKGSQNRD